MADTPASGAGKKPPIAPAASGSPPDAALGTGLRTILSALQAHADATGLRAAAREAGLSPSGLQNIFDGAVPYRPTRMKLEDWYQRHLAGQHDTAQEVALQILLRQMPRPSRARAREQILAILRGDDPCGQDADPPS